MHEPAIAQARPLHHCFRVTFWLAVTKMRLPDRIEGHNEAQRRAGSGTRSAVLSPHEHLSTREHELATSTSSVDQPALAGKPLDPLKEKALSYVRELGVKPEHTKSVLIGASVAAGLAVVVIALRARRRRHEPELDGSGVFGVIMKGALFAALQTIVKVKVAQLTANAAQCEPDRTPLEARAQ